MSDPKIVNPEWASEIEPTHSGAFGKAWKCEYTQPETLTDQERAAFETSCGEYLIHAPQAHPFWTWYYMAGISLRDDIPGSPPASRQFEGATHELVVLSLDPDHAAPLPNGEFGQHGQLHPLSPPDHVVQTMHVNDEQFGEILDRFAQAVVNGVLSPDSDYRESWRQTMMNTTDHFRGLHDKR